MARYSASQARQLFFRLLDAAERGEEVILERRDTRFRLTVVEEPAGTVTTPILRIRDPDVLAGEWYWVSDEDGELHFEPGAGPAGA
jgi:hypothetical protein